MSRYKRYDKIEYRIFPGGDWRPGIFRRHAEKLTEERNCCVIGNKNGYLMYSLLDNIRISRDGSMNKNNPNKAFLQHGRE